MPTSAPKLSTPGKDKNLKLRASCDSCAASKVKCSKEHPICARCLVINSPCIYGISRKHGKPGRTRKRNADGTPFVKAAKQRLSSGGSEFSKFMLQYPLQQTELETTSNWNSDWSPTPSLSTRSGFDSETAPGSSYANETHPVTGYMDTVTSSTQQTQPKPMPTSESDQIFQEPFVQEQLVQSDYSDWQALNNYIGGNDVRPVDYYSAGVKTTGHLRSASSASVPYSPMGQTLGSHSDMTTHPNVTVGNAHCCYPLAYSTLDSLRHIKHTYPVSTKESFNAVHPVIRSARENVLQLLKCSCSSDPHLAMLYSSIIFKILAWYQTAASANSVVHAGASVSASSPWSYCQPSPLSQTVFSPLSASSFGEVDHFNTYLQPSHFRQYDADVLEQQEYIRKLIMNELRGCGPLVETLANWRGNGQDCEKAEFLYDFLGGWLKSELYKMVQDIGSKDLCMN